VETLPQGAWDPGVYERFAAERSRPFEDLLALVERRPGMRVVDLGCGSGALTRRLHDALSAETTLGLDSSSEMLARSAEHAGNGVAFRVGDLAEFAPERPPDLVFSNAALHWVPDHPALFARLARLLAPGGQLAVQVPDQEAHASHATARDVAREEPFASRLPGGARISPVLAPEEYASLLFRLGFRDQTVRLQIYGHPLESRADVVEWVKGTLLTDYKKRLGPDLFVRFLTRYGERLMERLPDERPFFYPYRRILMWGRLAR
jgi:trans-aconitate 2-methyltransferase